MEHIIHQLSEIEHTAVDIVAHATEEKKRCKQKLEEKQKLLKAEIDASTTAKLQELTQHLEQGKSQAIDELRTKTDAVLIALEQEYEQHHSEYARIIFDQIVGN